VIYLAKGPKALLSSRFNWMCSCVG